MIRSFGKKLFRQNKGQGIIEFALIVPVLLMLVFGVVDFSRLAFNKVLLDHIARETLRIASVGSDLTLLTERTKPSVESLIGDVMSSSSADGVDDEGNPCTILTFIPTQGYSLSLYITPPYNSSMISGNSLRVAVFYRIDYLTPIAGNFASPQDLKAVYYTQIEKPPS